MEKKMYELRVDPQLEKVAPPLKDNELTLLREDILEHGCKYPLIVWNGVIVDGHNRYRICTEEDIPFGIEEMEFDSLTDAKLWIIKNQLGRRNLTAYQKCEMVLPYEEIIKNRAKENMSCYSRTGDRPATSIITRDELANMAGVSHGTMDKAKYIFVNGDEETKRRVRNGEISIHFAFSSLTGKPRRASATNNNLLENIRSNVASVIEKLKNPECDKELVMLFLNEAVEQIDKELGR